MIAAPYPMIPNPSMMEYIEPKRRREKFLPEEDDKLRELVDKYGINAWDTIAECMNGRNARQCRERWKHYLSSSRGKAPWTDEEDKLLLEKMEELGPKWTKIATFFQDRTDIQIKTRWMQKFASFSNLHLKNRSKNHQIIMPSQQQINQSICLPPQFIQGMMPPNFQPPPQLRSQIKQNPTFTQQIQPTIQNFELIHGHQQQQTINNNKNTPTKITIDIQPNQQVTWPQMENFQNRFQIPIDQNSMQKKYMPSPRIPIQSDEEAYDSTEFQHGSQNFWDICN